MDNVEEPGTQMKRRTVVKGAAWAAPVVTMGVAAPMATASPPPVFPELTPGQTCKHTGNEPHVYHVAVTWNNTLDCDTIVNITKLKVVPESGSEVTFSSIPSFSVAEGDTVSQYYDSNPTGNLANGTAVVTYEYQGCDDSDGDGAKDWHDGTAELSFPALPPCDKDMHPWP